MRRSLLVLCVLLVGSNATTAADEVVPAGRRLRFIAVGDTGSGHEGQRTVARAMANKCKQSGCDFVVLLGDNVYESGVSSPTDPQFQTKFEQPYADVDAPFYVALGNHDYGGRGMGNEFDKPNSEIAYSKLSKKWRLPARSYHFTAGAAELFALDTNAVLWGVGDVSPTPMATWVAQSTRRWKIAFGHHPYRSNGPHGNAGVYDQTFGSPVTGGSSVKAYLESAICGKVDLYLAGHDHDRQWLMDTCAGTELAVSGAGSSTTSLIGNNPVRFSSEQLGFLYVVLDDKTLTAEFIGTDGKTDFTRTLTKK